MKKLFLTACAVFCTAAYAGGNIQEINQFCKKNGRQIAGLTNAKILRISSSLTEGSNIDENGEHYIGKNIKCTYEIVESNKSKMTQEVLFFQDGKAVGFEFLSD
ncbi:hypothetical protein [Neisseria cinerea]|uniref:hypothetical protein n=1 Tax=Neisseria cinerea TaxID=483 RepID=UPI0027DFE1DB|nr:hypothetical protein [Neisseria cinerea]